MLSDFGASGKADRVNIFAADEQVPHDCASPGNQLKHRARNPAGMANLHNFHDGQRIFSGRLYDYCVARGQRGCGFWGTEFHRIIKRGIGPPKRQTAGIVS